MWSRAQLKENGKRSFKRVYTSSVIVCLIVSLLGFILDGGKSPSGSVSNINQQNYNVTENISPEDTNGTKEILNNYVEKNTLAGRMGSILNKLSDSPKASIFELAGSAALSSIVLAIVLIAIIIRVIILNPIEVGKNNFFMGIRESDRSVSDILFVFKDQNWIKTSVTMFFMNLFTWLWTLLLIIPGIVKSYEYKMIPYILAENTDIDRHRAFEISKNMMQGQKFDTFVLDLSFIGWQFLSGITWGIAGILYVNPYVEATTAELYAVLREDALRRGIVSLDELPGFSNKN